MKVIKKKKERHDETQIIIWASPCLRSLFKCNLVFIVFFFLISSFHDQTQGIDTMFFSFTDNSNPSIDNW